MFSSPAIAAIAIAVFTALVFVAGFAVADWRANGEIEKLRSDNKMLTGANGRCVSDLKEVRKAVDSVLETAREREKSAQNAMKEVQPVIERKKAKVIQIRSLPTVAPDQQCEAIRTEQAAYVQYRKEENE